MRLELHPEARAEIRSAALWYDERHSGLGDEFIAEVSAALDRITDVPESYPPWQAVGPMIRKATIHRFHISSLSKITSSTYSSLRWPTPSVGRSTGSRARASDRVQNVSKPRGELRGIAKTPVDSSAVLTRCR